MALLTDELIKELHKAYPDLTAVQLFPLAQAEAILKLKNSIDDATDGGMRVIIDNDPLIIDGGLDVKAVNSFS